MFNTMCKCKHRQSTHSEGGNGHCRASKCECYKFQTVTTQSLTSEELSIAIEKEIDRFSLLHVLIGLACICHEKAEHLEANWQEKRLARQWKTAGDRLVAMTRTLPAVPGISE